MKNVLVILLALLCMVVKGESFNFKTKAILSSDKNIIFEIIYDREKGESMCDTFNMYFVGKEAIRVIDSVKTEYLCSYGICPVTDSVVNLGTKIFPIKRYIKRQLVLKGHGVGLATTGNEFEFNLNEKLIYGLLWYSLLVTAIVSVVSSGFVYPRNQARLGILIFFLCCFLFFFLRSDARFSCINLIDAAVMSGILFLPSFILSFIRIRMGEKKKKPV